MNYKEFKRLLSYHYAEKQHKKHMRHGICSKRSAKSAAKNLPREDSANIRIVYGTQI